MEQLPSEVFFYILNEVNDVSQTFQKLLKTNKSLFGYLLCNDAFWHRQWLQCFSIELDAYERAKCRKFISETETKVKHKIFHKHSGVTTNSVTPQVSEWFWLFRARAQLSYFWLKRKFQVQKFKKPSQAKVHLIRENPNLLGTIPYSSTQLTIHSLKDGSDRLIQLSQLTEEICFLIAHGQWLLTDIRSLENEESSSTERIINILNFKTNSSYDIHVNSLQLKKGFLRFREPILVLEKTSELTPECVIIDIREKIYTPVTFTIEPEMNGIFEENFGEKVNKMPTETYAIDEVFLHPRLPIVMVLTSGQAHFFMHHGEAGTKRHVTHLLNIDLNLQVTKGHWNEFEFPNVTWQKQPDRQSGYIEDSCAIITWLVHPLDPLVASTNSGIYCLKVGIDSSNCVEIKCDSCGENHRIPKMQIDWRTRFTVRLWTESNDWRHYDENQIFSFNPRNLIVIAIRTHSQFVFLNLTRSSGSYTRYTSIDALSKYSKYHITKFPNLKPTLSVMNKQLCQLQFISCESGELLDSWDFRDNTKSPRKLKRRTQHISVASSNEEALIVTPQLHYLFFGENVHHHMME
ncbi:hypothetical protein K7432_009499 [Basidiobolus ranarum]|uniref:F-box domain-containing protein n=1 Tax=Basidiobolus ranarum TaxID=34480 RepID=A0ABR2VX08_9FUNG